MSDHAFEIGAPSVTGEHAAALQQLGSQIRSLRRQRGVTLKQLAAQTGVSVSLLSMVERNDTNPSIGTLVAVADALNVPVARLFEGSAFPSDPQTPVVPSELQRQYVSETGMRQRIIVHDATRGFEWTENRYEPGASSSTELLHHQGYEWGFVVSGRLEVSLDDKTFVLNAGDGIHFDSQRPHRFSNPGPHDAVTYWANLFRPSASEKPVDARRPSDA